MKKQFIKISLEDAELVVKEYDADFDCSLSLEEFEQLCLPSTNQSMRRLC